MRYGHLKWKHFQFQFETVTFKFPKKAVSVFVIIYNVYFLRCMWIYPVVSNDLQLEVHIILVPHTLLVDIRDFWYGLLSVPACSFSCIYIYITIKYHII